jgi:hypothetical protein
MRFPTLTTLITLACGLAVAAEGPQPVTYISGNLDGLAPNTGATVDVSGSKAIALNNGAVKVEVPYAAISRAELGQPTEVTTESEPLYKVWTLHKRFLPKRTVQQVTVDYRTAAGENKTLTIEAEQHVAEGVIAAIEERTTPPSEKVWWGDTIWKTTRNKDQWGGAGTVASREE